MMFIDKGKVITKNDYSAPYHFRLDSAFIHKIANDYKDKGYTTAFFHNANGGIIYKTASITDTLMQIPNFKGYKLFPLYGRDNKDFVLITNTNNELIGYIKLLEISFDNKNDVEQFYADIRRIRFKYELD